jgi:hypothetical protein
MGCHWLRVETRRREGLDRPNRTCPHYSLGVVEDEHHMVFDCPKYARLRADYSESLFGVGQGPPSGPLAGQGTLAQVLAHDSVEGPPETVKRLPSPLLHRQLLVAGSGSPLPVLHRL